MKINYKNKWFILFAALISASLLAIPVIAQFTYPNRRGHFWASWVSTVDGGMQSNLYGFGHMSTPWHGDVVDWVVSSVDYYGNERIFTGTFTIEVFDTTDYISGGEIYIAFVANLERIPLITDPVPHPGGEPNAHIHFWGRFLITGGTGQYASLRGRGDISGTIHLHEPIDVEPPYYDLVLVGKWRT